MRYPLLSAIGHSLRTSFFSSSKGRTPPRRERRRLAFESLETREMMAVVGLQDFNVSATTGEKPQAKAWEYAGQMWSVMSSSNGTWVRRLDGTSWTPVHQITSASGFHADVKTVGDLAHVLLYKGASSQFATLQFDAGPDNRYEAWQLQPQLTPVPVGGGSETSTLEVDSTRRMWVTYDPGSSIKVRYSDGLFTNWSEPITVASGIKSDDISTIMAMPNNSIAVMWSNQNTRRFGFRTHVDGTLPTQWTADELPASQSALKVGKGMADDHINVTVASDGTVYAAVKTSYDTSGRPKIALLVRRPNGTWDDLYTVATQGTRPIVLVNEAARRLIVAHTTVDGGGNIVYRESSMDNIAFGPRKTLLSGSLNDVTSTTQTFTDQVVVMAAGGGRVRSALFSFDTINMNQA